MVPIVAANAAAPLIPAAPAAPPKPNLAKPPRAKVPNLVP